MTRLATIAERLHCSLAEAAGWCRFFGCTVVLRDGSLHAGIDYTGDVYADLTTIQEPQP